MEKIVSGRRLHDVAGFLCSMGLAGLALLGMTGMVYHALAPNGWFTGWLSRRVVGKRMLELFEHTLERVPLAKTIYGGTKQLLEALQTKPDGTQRVVLIDFPSPEMKTIGLVTRVLKDARTGEEVAAVYVPTTPNPTSGYLEIVPVDRLIATDWSVDQAMAFVLSVGAVAPDAAFPAVTPPRDGNG